jgi:tRNA1Val (adenine37-N6)-methyltransferase
VTNPPYFKGSLRNPDEKKASARHDVSLSLAEILQYVPALMKPDVKFQIILPYAEGNIFIADAAGYGLYCNSILKIRPLPTSEIRRLILGFSRKRKKVSEKFLTIEKGKRHEFTPEYIDLTRDFYLRF